MKTKIIAEIGINHNGDLSLGFDLIDSAYKCGVTAVKFQTYSPELRFNAGNPFIDVFKKYSLTFDEEFKLWEYAKSKKLEVITTPFDKKAVSFCRENNILDGLKIASFETTNQRLVRDVASLHLPVYFSTGQNSIEEVKNVVSILQMSDIQKIIPMHCISSYPMKVSDANLSVINRLKNEFNLEVGFSDHSRGHFVSGLAVAMGCICIEKHFTLDNNLDGPDHSFSLNPSDLKKLVEHINEVEIALGSDWMGVRDCEKLIKNIARRESK